MAAVKGLKLSRKELDHAVDRLLDTVNLREEGKRKIGEFSGGMRQRLGIDQALLGRFCLFLQQSYVCLL